MSGRCPVSPASRRTTGRSAGLRGAAGTGRSRTRRPAGCRGCASRGRLARPVEREIRQRADRLARAQGRSGGGARLAPARSRTRSSGSDRSSRTRCTRTWDISFVAHHRAAARELANPASVRAWPPSAPPVSSACWISLRSRSASERSGSAGESPSSTCSASRRRPAANIVRARHSVSLGGAGDRQRDRPAAPSDAGRRDGDPGLALETAAVSSQSHERRRRTRRPSPAGPTTTRGRTQDRRGRAGPWRGPRRGARGAISRARPTIGATAVRLEPIEPVQVGQRDLVRPARARPRRRAVAGPPRPRRARTPPRRGAAVPRTRAAARRPRCGPARCTPARARGRGRGTARASRR